MCVISSSLESRLSAIAESVASGELSDASLEFCSRPLLAEEGSREAGIGMRLGERKKISVKGVEKRRRKDRPRKTAPVDQGI